MSLASQVSTVITRIGQEFKKQQSTNLPYATAAALSVRPTVPPGASIRIWGGLLTDADPSWMIDGDYRDIPSAT